MPAAAVVSKKARAVNAARDESSKRSLARAFQTFTLAADSLEKSYGQLQAEVLRLRFELERTNKDLAASLEENARMRDYLARVVAGLPCGILVVDREAQIRITNPEARRLLTQTAEESQSAAAVAPQMLRRLLESSRSGSTQTEQVWRIGTAKEPRLIGLSCAVLGDGTGRGSSSESVFLLRDITEERRRASELEATRRKESLAEMATLLAHEIRNPLGSLELFAGLLADAAADQPDLRRWTDHIQAGLRSLSATVNNVLQFHSHPVPQLVSVNIGRLTRESVEFLRPLARQAGLRIDLQNSLGELDILADAHRVQQVFFNLALNAFRAMSVGGTLCIRLRWADHDRLNDIRIEFEDNGRGIAAEHLPRIFEPGFTTNAGNPGLGLAVCRSVAEQHGGNLQVSSEPGKGATFALILPRAGAAR
jgi:signal transduction histidine kinase